MAFFKRIFSRPQPPPEVFVVSGLPRSGTSMMMKMLEAGGVPALTDGIRLADTDNPKGYYELEQIKDLAKQVDKSWLKDAAGHCVKVISELLIELPPFCRYRVIFMNRDLHEIIASQNRMLQRRGEEKADDDEAMIDLFSRHLGKIKDWLRRQSHFRILYLDYGGVLEDPPGNARQVKEFLGLDLDIELMAAVCDPALYRNRRSRLVSQ